ncbi:MAG TPA: FAD-dependent oxidoreductase [Polyangiaceae bacterium]|nr:FAD-dependent oxidoreductase [Polyangiaceae bacterium]
MSTLASFPALACSAKHPEPSGGPRIAVVGAGIAGLTAAYRLGQAGLSAKVFDSWNRVGGRMFTARGMWADEQLTELGGELIDTDHDALRGLAEELGLTLDPILESPGSGIRQDTWFFDGRLVTDAAIVEAFRPVAVRLQADVDNEEDEDEFARIDELGLSAYLDSIPDLDPMLRTLLDVAYVGEYGREISEQSPWNLLWLIDAETPDPFRVYGDSDEAFHVHGGNDQIPTGLADRLSSPIELEHTLVNVTETASGTYRLAFDRSGGSSVEEEFDRVVFALPFTRLRDVALPESVPAEKKEIIGTLGMGTNAKLMAQFRERVWRTQHQASGSVTTDNGLQLLWETSRGMSGTAGILTVFAGGRIGEQIGEGTAETQIQSRLASLDQIFPNTGATYIANSAVRMHWPSVEHTRGSYTCYLPGQASFSGLEGERVGNLHFCGEHTSVDHQGYMNGGAETGERVANEIMADLGIEKRVRPAALRRGA